MPNFDFLIPKATFPTAIEVDFNFGAGDLRLLAGTSNNITAIWASFDANKDNGFVYIASYGEGAAFSIVDLNLKLLYDRYTKTVKGRANIVLPQEDIKDIVV